MNITLQKTAAVIGIISGLMKIAKFLYWLLSLVR